MEGVNSPGLHSTPYEKKEECGWHVFAMEMNLQCVVKYERAMKDSYPLPRSRPKSFKVPPSTPEWAVGGMNSPGLRSTSLKKRRMWQGGVGGMRFLWR